MQSAALVLDSLQQRHMDPVTLWDGLPIAALLERRHRARLDWTIWVEMMERVERASALPLEELFVPGVGVRAGHPFIQVANRLLSLRDLYGLFARWGLPRAFTVVRARMQSIDRRHARLAVTIDPARVGSLPTLRFFVGIVRGLPSLQGYPDARVELMSATPHRAEYRIELPVERPLRTRARRLLHMIGGFGATLDELEHQAAEIATKNVQLERQIAELRETSEALREREAWLDVALAAGTIGLCGGIPRTTPCGSRRCSRARSA